MNFRESLRVTDYHLLLTNGLAGYSPEALLYFSQLDPLPSQSVLRQVAIFIDALVHDGIYERVDEMWLFAMNTDTNALKGIKAYKTCSNVGMTFSAYEGFHNATASTANYLNTNYNPSVDKVSLNVASGSLGIYSRTNNQTNAYDFGCLSTSNGYMNIRCRTTTDQLTSNTFVNSTLSLATTTALGFSMSGVTSSVARFVSRNGSYNEFANGFALTVPNLPLFISRYAGTSAPPTATNRQYSFAFVGAGLNSEEVANFHTRLEELLDFLGIGVVA